MAKTTDELQIKPLKGFRQLPIEQGFDWASIIENAKKLKPLDSSRPLYLVVFRSKLKPDADVVLLHEHDSRAHEAAKRSPALIHYYADTADEEGRALSFCIWSDREKARIVSRDPDHAAATKLTSMYEYYRLEKYDVDFCDADSIRFTSHQS